MGVEVLVLVVVGLAVVGGFCMGRIRLGVDLKSLCDSLNKDTVGFAIL